MFPAHEILGNRLTSTSNDQCQVLSKFGRPRSRRWSAGDEPPAQPVASSTQGRGSPLPVAAVLQNMPAQHTVSSAVCKWKQHSVHEQIHKWETQHSNQPSYNFISWEAEVTGWGRIDWPTAHPASKLLFKSQHGGWGQDLRCPRDPPMLLGDKRGSGTGPVKVFPEMRWPLRAFMERKGQTRPSMTKKTHRDMKTLQGARTPNPWRRRAHADCRFRAAGAQSHWWKADT